MGRCKNQGSDAQRPEYIDRGMMRDEQFHYVSRINGGCPMQGRQAAIASLHLHGIDACPMIDEIFRHHCLVPFQPEAVTANGAAKEPPAEAKPRADLTGQGTILLVEDEEGLRSLNARGLRSRGYSVIEASNGIEAMEALEEKNGAVDLVVSDVVMPEMDGPTLLREMRARNPNLKIIFVSGYAEDAFEKSLPENEQFAFLPKPFALSALVEKVKQTMAPP